MSNTPKRQYSAPALEKGLDILEYLAEQKFARSQMEIAKALGRSQSENYRMLSCLQERGYVLKETGSGNYRLSLRLYELASRQSSTMLLRRAALLPMDKLTEATNQSCHLSVQHGDKLIVLIERMPSQHVCLAVGEGTVLPLSQAASGHVLLSRMPEEVAREALESDQQFTSSSAKAQQALLASLTEIRKQEHYVTASVQTQSVMDIVVPIGVDNTDTVAVLTLPFIAQEKTANKVSSLYLKSVLAAAKEINSNLGIST